MTRVSLLLRCTGGFFTSMHGMLVPISLRTCQCRRIYLINTVASFVFVGILLHLRFQTRIVPSTLDSGIEHPVFEIEGLPLGTIFHRNSHLAADAHPLEWLIEPLKARFQLIIQTGDQSTPGYPNCTLNLERYTQIALKSPHAKVDQQPHTRLSVISFAINLRNFQGIIPAQAAALLEAIAYLLLENKVYVSIYENDSDDKTRLLLSDFGAALQAIGVDGLWIRSSNMRSAFDTQDRITMLSEIRNFATRDAEGAWLNPWGDDNHRTWLDPLWPPAKDAPADAASQGTDSG